MKVIQCPREYNGDAGSDTPFTVFMAGGISNCPNWQKEMIDRFKKIPGLEDLVLFNPLRDNFDISDPNMSIAQIRWEHAHLDMADAILFWFPFQTVCPITLYELGVYAAKGKPIYVGCHPAYSRLLDVREQLALIRPDVTVHESFEDLISEVVLAAAKRNK